MGETRNTHPPFKKTKDISYTIQNVIVNFETDAYVCKYMSFFFLVNFTFCNIL